MKINGIGNISDIFSIFHDGGIVKCDREHDQLIIEVEIEYLAQRVNPEFTKFVVCLSGAENIQFSTWPSDLKSPPEVLVDESLIFEPELEILESNVKDGAIQVICNQHSHELDYCGGELSFIAKSAEVTDEAEKVYSLEELDTICKEYWDEWSNKNKA